MKRKLIAGALMAVMCSGAFAAHNSSSVYGGLGVGGYFNHSHSSNGPGVNGILGYAFNDNLSAQLSLNYFTNDQAAALVEGIWNLPNSTNWTPYAALGAGYMHLSTHSMGVDAGVGVKYALASNAYASLDYRYLQSFGSKTPNGSMVSLGLGFYFGGTDHDLSSSGMSAKQSKREQHYHKTYALPHNVRECQSGTSAVTRESIGCYSVDGDKVVMHLDAKFAYDSYDLDAKAKAAINNLVTFMDEYDIKKVELRGYASKGKTGPAYAAYNQRLSVNRAQAVKSYLISQGVRASNIDVVGYGYTRPLVPNTTKENQSINQRVETSVPVPLRQS